MKWTHLILSRLWITTVGNIGNTTTATFDALKTMAKIAVIAFIATAATTASAQIPDLPPNACHQGCTKSMQTTLANFINGEMISFTPAVYSGECKHLTRSLDPEKTHYSAVLIDNQLGTPKFYTMFSYYAENNEYQNWNLEVARREMSKEWEKYPILVGSDTARIEVMSKGSPVYVYWMRQNHAEDRMHLIMYAGGTAQKAFCELKKH